MFPCDTAPLPKGVTFPGFLCVLSAASFGMGAPSSAIAPGMGAPGTGMLAATVVIAVGCGGDRAAVVAVALVALPTAAGGSCGLRIATAARIAASSTAPPSAALRFV